MTAPTEITITDAVKAKNINRNTLNSWVRNKKIVSRKAVHGKKEVIFIEVASLEAHLAKRNHGKGHDAKEAEPDPHYVRSPSNDTTVPDSPTPEVEKSATLDSAKKGRQKPRVKPPRQHAKNMMRSFSIADLLNVQAWITQRLESRIGAADEPVAT